MSEYEAYIGPALLRDRPAGTEDYLAWRLGVETPVTDTVQGLLHGGESPREAVMRLMTRTLRQE